MKTTHTFTAPEVMVPAFKLRRPRLDERLRRRADASVLRRQRHERRLLAQGLPPNSTPSGLAREVGTMTQSVTIGEKETKNISFTFKVPAAAAD